MKTVIKWIIGVIGILMIYGIIFWGVPLVACIVTPGLTFYLQSVLRIHIIMGFGLLIGAVIVGIGFIVAWAFNRD